MNTGREEVSRHRTAFDARHSMVHRWNKLVLTVSELTATSVNLQAKDEALFTMLMTRDKKGGGARWVCPMPTFSQSLLLLLHLLSVLVTAS